MTLKYKNIAYVLKRSKRKTASIQIERDGQVSLRVPLHMTIPQIEMLMANKEAWVRRHLNARQIIRRKNRQRYDEGTRFPYLGKSYCLKIVDDQTAPLLLKSGRFHLKSDYQSRPEADQAFKAFYCQQGMKKVRERVAYFQNMIGVQANRIRIVETKTRWASCSSIGNLNFHWKCLMFPKEVFDYIIVHEVSHLVHLNHSKHFWAQVEKIIPDYKLRREWLRDKGVALDL